MSLSARFVAVFALMAALMGGAVVLVPNLDTNAVRSDELSAQHDIAETALRREWAHALERMALSAPLVEQALDEWGEAIAAKGIEHAVVAARANRGWLLQPNAGLPIEFGAGKSVRDTPRVQSLIRTARAAGRASSLVVDGSTAAWVQLVALPSTGAVGGLELTVDSALLKHMVDGLGSQVVLAAVRPADGRAREIGAFGEPEIIGSLLASTGRIGNAASVDVDIDGVSSRLLSLDAYEGGRLVAGLRADAAATFARPEGPSQLLAGALAAIALLGMLLIALMTRGLRTVLTRLDVSAHSAIEGRKEHDLVVCDRNDELGRFVRTFNTMTESLRQREQRIRQTAYRDPVTKLPTRVLFDERVGSMLNAIRAKGLSASMMLIQVDQLRDISESLGRQAAEKLLAELAERFRSVLRGTRKLERENGEGEGQESSVLARTGAYEFAVMLRECDTDTARKVGLRLADMASKRFRFEGQSLTISVRVGIAGFPEHGAAIPDLVQSADFAVVAASQDVGGVAIYNPQFETEREKQLAMLVELRQALEQRQMHMVFQPKVSLKGESALMAEALMRWEHPERGPQNPAEFVDFAEKTGFINKMTLWAIDGSLRHAAEWQRQGLPMSISVNMSRRDLISPEFPTQVVTILRQYGLKGAALMLEISEAVLVGAPAVLFRNLELLGRLGVSIAVDNFGSGFGSVEMLSKLPLSALKIDRRYVSRLDTDASAAIVVRAAIDLARAMGIRSVAEGVESAAQLAMLREMGCDQAQGYYLGRPLTRDDFEIWVRHQANKFGIEGTARELRPSSAGAIAAAMPGTPGQAAGTGLPLGQS